MAEGKYVGTGADRRWQNSDGTYMYEKPGGGRQFLSELTELFVPGGQAWAHNSDPYKTSHISPSQPVRGQESTAERVKRREAAGLRNHRQGGGNQNRSGVTPVNGSYRTAVEAGPDGKVTPGTIPASVNDVALVRDSTVYSGRDDSRTSPTGLSQKGTNMSRSFNDLLATTNTSGYQPYSSNQLPTTEGSPDSGVTPKTQAILAGIQAGKQTDMSIDGYEGPSYTAIQPDSPQFAEAFGQDLADKYKSAADSKVTGYTKGGRLDQALSDKAGINSYMSKFSSGDQERAANRAFLDTEGSMAGLRAKEAVNGVVYAGGQHYVAGKSGDDKAVAIDRSAARDISNGNETSAGASQKAQDLLAKKTGDIVAATKQAPTVLEDGAKDGAFKQDKPMFTGSTPAIGGAVEFDNNNDKTLPTFGNNGGYKSGFKKIDTTMTNPFG